MPSTTECRVHRLVADIAVLAQGQVLMVKYRDTSRYDHQRGWFLPDDYLQYLEHPADGVRRIAREQAGLDLGDIRLADLESFGNGWWHLAFHYAAALDRLPTATPGANVAAAEWFDLNRLPDSADVAHEGWALEVLQRVLGEPAAR